MKSIKNLFFLLALCCCAVASAKVYTMKELSQIPGIGITEVKPPAAAAAVPVAIVSLYSNPGSRKCTWTSAKAGSLIVCILMSPLASASEVGNEFD